MVNICCVDGCKKGSEENVTLFKFPTSRAHRRKWLDAINLSGKLSSKDIAGSVICNNHFNENDYEDVRGKIRLKRKVVPCLFGNEENNTSPKSPKEPDIPQDPTGQPDVETAANVENEKVSDNGVVNESPVAPEMRRVIEESTDSASESIEENCIEVTPQIPEESPPPTPEMDTNKQDIEDILTSYHLKNTPGEKQIHPIAEDPVPDVPMLPMGPMLSMGPMLPMGPVAVPAVPLVSDVLMADRGSDSDIEFEPVAKPVFIEISVSDKDPSASNMNGSAQDDCLMLLENVQVDIDPSSLMLPERDEFDLVDEEKKADPISLLTSSDDDDVILEEPHIDTVEVSDETDEDDMPLVKLVKRPTKLSKKNQISTDNITKMFWGMYEYYCMECHFTTTSRGDYKTHVKEHATVIQICQMCGYTTASKAQFARHKRKHKDDRKFKCHLCDYKAKHNMSLIYHLKSHDQANLSSCKKGFKCKKCNFRSDVKSSVLKHVRMCSMDVKKFSCNTCSYETKRPSDLRRHIARRHSTLNEEQDEEFGMT